MRLYPDWKKILRKAWSLRLIALAGVLTGCEALVSVYGVEWLPVPVWARLLLIFGVMAGAFWARLVAQPNTLGDD